MGLPSVDQLWYLPNLIAFFLIIGILLWQSISTKDYERKHRQSCEDELEKLQEDMLTLRIENERLRMLLVARGINISGGQVTVSGDMAGGDKTTRPS